MHVSRNLNIFTFWSLFQQQKKAEVMQRSLSLLTPGGAVQSAKVMFLTAGGNLGHILTITIQRIWETFCDLNDVRLRMLLNWLSRAQKNQYCSEVLVRDGKGNLWQPGAGLCGLILESVLNCKIRFVVYFDLLYRSLWFVWDPLCCRVLETGGRNKPKLTRHTGKRSLKKRTN